MDRGTIANAKVELRWGGDCPGDTLAVTTGRQQCTTTVNNAEGVVYGNFDTILDPFLRHFTALRTNPHPTVHAIPHTRRATPAVPHPPCDVPYLAPVFAGMLIGASGNPTLCPIILNSNPVTRTWTNTAQQAENVYLLVDGYIQGVEGTFTVSWDVRVQGSVTTTSPTLMPTSPPTPPPTRPPTPPPTPTPAPTTSTSVATSGGTLRVNCQGGGGAPSYPDTNAGCAYRCISAAYSAICAYRCVCSANFVCGTPGEAMELDTAAGGGMRRPE